MDKENQFVEDQGYFMLMLKWEVSLKLSKYTYFSIDDESLLFSDREINTEEILTTD